MEEVLLFNKFFPIADMCLSCKDTARQSCVMVPRGRIFGDFLRRVFSASDVQMVDMADIQCTTAEIRRGQKKKKKNKEETTG